MSASKYLLIRRMHILSHFTLSLLTWSVLLASITGGFGAVNWDLLVNFGAEAELSNSEEEAPAPMEKKEKKQFQLDSEGEDEGQGTDTVKNLPTWPNASREKWALP